MLVSSKIRPLFNKCHFDFSTILNNFIKLSLFVPEFQGFDQGMLLNRHL